MASLTPRTGSTSGTLLNPVTGLQSAPYSATNDGSAGTGVALEGQALFNNSGTFDRQREVLALGQALVGDPQSQQALTQLVDTMRAVALALTVTNNLLGGPVAKFQPDLLALGDLLAAAAKGAPADPNTLQ